MLYRRSNSRFWWCRFAPPGGTEVRRSTGTEDKQAAEEYEARLKTESWRVARLGEKPRHTWQDAVVRWVAETDHKASHPGDLIHLRWLDPHLQGKRLDEIDKALIDRLAMARKQEPSRRGKPYSNAAINRMLALLRSVLRRAATEWEWLDKAPAVRLLPEPKKRIRWLTQQEAEALIAQCPPHLAALVRFSLATGLRERNVTKLEWSQIDLERRVAWVHPDQIKTRTALGVPLNRDAVLVLREQQGRHPRRVFCYPLPRDGGLVWTPIDHANATAWRHALERAGIKDFRWHDLRHTWASWHVQAGTPLHVLQELGGWQSPAMVQRYAHLAPEHLSVHAARIETPLAMVEPVRTFSGTSEKEKAA